MRESVYRCEAQSEAGFIQQLAVSYIGNGGYWYYIMGEVPEEKDPQNVDEKLIERYGVNISKWARGRRRALGFSNVHYLRFERRFILIASPGEGDHQFFVKEPHFRDVRRDSICFGGYCIGYKQGADGKWHPSVRIHPAAYRRLRAYFREIAVHWPVEALIREFQGTGFEFYAPVRRQVANVVRMVNRLRKAASMEWLAYGAIDWRRRPVSVFVPGAGGVGQAPSLAQRLLALPEPVTSGATITQALKQRAHELKVFGGAGIEAGGQGGYDPWDGFGTRTGT